MSARVRPLTPLRFALLACTPLFLAQTPPPATVPSAPAQIATSPETQPAHTRPTTIPPPELRNATVFRDVPYVKDGHDRQKLDIAIPPSDKPTPVVIWLHGGAWLGGSKSLQFPATMLKEGVAVVAINYRYSSQAVYPAQIEDCKSAIRFLRANAEKYNLDKNRFAVWGVSAGGHLAALVGTTGDVHELDGKNPQNADQSSAVLCVVDLFGPTDILNYAQMVNNPKANDADGILGKLLGGDVQQKKELAIQASPVSFVNKGDPPFLIIHGDKDPLVPLKQSEALHEALKKAGVESELIVVKNGGHGNGMFNEEVVRKVRAFTLSHFSDAVTQKKSDKKTAS